MEVAGIEVGIVGVMTIDALRSTIAANVQGLRMAPLESTVAAEAAKLRRAGAEVVIVVAHAGGRCERFDQPDDLSSCDPDSEIFRLARGLPGGLVDVIVAGHTHGGLGHRVEGIGIIQPYSRGQAFGRVDVVFDPTARKVALLQLFPPRQICSREDPTTGACASAAGPGVAAEYEGRPVTADAAVTHAMERELGRVAALKAEPLGLLLDDAIPRVDEGRMPLGDLVAEALRSAVPGADVAAINNAGRLRADLADGQLTFGQLYEMFPFDNRLVRVTLTGAELSRWLANEIGRRGQVAISGVDVHARCLADGVQVDLFRGTERIDDGEQLVGVTIGAPSLIGNLASPDFLGGVGPVENNPVAREVVEDWFRNLGRLAASERERFLSPRPGVGCAIG
jgi:5'-nucleotidase